MSDYVTLGVGEIKRLVGWRWSKQWEEREQRVKDKGSGGGL